LKWEGKREEGGGRGEKGRGKLQGDCTRECRIDPASSDILCTPSVNWG